MSKLLLFVQAYGQIILVAIFWAIMLTLLISQLRLLRRTRKLQQKIDTITGKVGDYLEYMMESDGEEAAYQPDQTEKIASERAHREEEESQLISSVLQEIFP